MSEKRPSHHAPSRLLSRADVPSLRPETNWSTRRGNVSDTVPETLPGPGPLVREVLGWFRPPKRLGSPREDGRGNSLPRQGLNRAETATTEILFRSTQTGFLPGGLCLGCRSLAKTGLFLGRPRTRAEGLLTPQELRVPYRHSRSDPGVSGQKVLWGGFSDTDPDFPKGPLTRGGGCGTQGGPNERSLSGRGPHPRVTSRTRRVVGGCGATGEELRWCLSRGGSVPPPKRLGSLREDGRRTPLPRDRVGDLGGQGFTGPPLPLSGPLFVPPGVQKSGLPSSCLRFPSVQTTAGSLPRSGTDSRHRGRAPFGATAQRRKPKRIKNLLVTPSSFWESYVRNRWLLPSHHRRGPYSGPPPSGWCLLA